MLPLDLDSRDNVVKQDAVFLQRDQSDSFSYANKDKRSVQIWA